MPILYTTHCAKCNILKVKLQRKCIDVIEVTDVGEMQALGLSTLPVLAVEGKLMGFVEANTWIEAQTCKSL
jgi:hypothetical protein